MSIFQLLFTSTSMLGIIAYIIVMLDLLTQRVANPDLQ